MDRYLDLQLLLMIEGLTDSELGEDLWSWDPDMDLDARELLDQELFLDLTGNLDSCA